MSLSIRQCSGLEESGTEAEEADLWAGALSCFITYHQMEMVNPGVYERSVGDLAKLGKEWTWLSENLSAARLQFVQSKRKSVTEKCCSSRNGEICLIHVSQVTEMFAHAVKLKIGFCVPMFQKFGPIICDV